ncbi:NAD(P)H-dependent glycerol-3-phosphate dehydrogenase [Hydrogenophaga sp.]|jgi:glycerol-3-phosphate dehydrogenase (NAD(P)+)|uniref:NAD(P)H-dependent glycerol-3-phosphate dehydrogenase n=1 Tax=Hydrogenophaga sp. TaxID=1904254 RepID=UPI003F6E8919
MKIVVLGAGAWGTALAASAAAQEGEFRQVSLWARDARQAEDMRVHRENRRYLPGLALPPTLALTSGPMDDHAAEWRDADLLVIGTPMAGLRGLLGQLTEHPSPVAWLCKGFEAPQEDAWSAGLLGHEIRAQVAPRLKAGVLSGPSFAQEVAHGQPTALVAASEHASVRDVLVAAFHSPILRVYANEDIVGVEVGGAIKNVLAIATGLCDGLGLGLNARAALITRGLAEMTRLGLALGARAETFMGLSGLGDLVLTATGDLSRNRKVGQLLAEGMNLRQAVDSLGHVAEGVYTARTAVQRARLLGVDMPISEAVVALLEGRLKPAQAVATLMGRDPKQETL